MDRLTRHPLLEDIPFEVVVDYTVEFIRIAGVPKVFVEKTEKVEIKDYRGVLPCDYYQIIQVRLLGKEKRVRAFRYSTDSFHMSNIKPSDSDLTYKIQGSCIFTSIRNGVVEIAYQAMPLDEEGYPLIPEGTYSRALELYIKKQWFNIQFDLGKISDKVMHNTQQEYAWAVGQAQNDLQMPSIDEMEALSNMWNKFLPDTTRDHESGFVHEGTKEHMINH